MSEARWYAEAEGTFEFRLPAGWTAEPDPEEGGVEVWREDGYGVLHLSVFPFPADEAPDPAEELYAFLHEQGVELEEDEVEDVALAGEAALALCEYLSEEEEEKEEEGGAFWLVGVAALSGWLLFAHYTCGAGDETQERDTVREVLRSLRAPGPGGAGGAGGRRA